MAKKKNKAPFIKKGTRPLIKAPEGIKKADEVFFLLDKFSADDIDRWKQSYQKLYEFYWDEYSYYAHQRTRKAESLKNAILEVCQPYTFKDWYRCIDVRHMLKPLSAVGSKISLQGGRFNIGQIDFGKFPSFPALYIAENQETSEREKFQVKKDNSVFDAFDFGLVKKSSYGFVRMHGNIELVIDITNDINLKPFLKQIKKLVPSEEIIKKAQALGVNVPDSIRTMKKLKETLTEWEWSSNPVVLDIPSNSQIFGLIAKMAGAHGILYKSKFYTGKCLAIFPENFNASTSFVQTTDPMPTDQVIARLDKNSWQQLV